VAQRTFSYKIRLFLFCQAPLSTLSAHPHSSSALLRCGLGCRTRQRADAAGFGRAPAQGGDTRGPAFGAFLAAVKNG
jgi:hypothetical protein